MARRKETTLSSVPAKGHPDRKRVLNVLAQQRYRERARERVKELEVKAASNAVPTPDSIPTSSSDGDENGVVATAAINTCSPSFIMSQWRSPSSSDSSADQGISSPPDWMNIDPNMFPADTTGQWFDIPNPSVDVSAENLQNLETAEFSFADDGLLQDPTLKMMRVGSDIATLLNCQNTIWDPAAVRVIDPTTIDLALPLSLQPVDEQLQLPHHPMLDILPWPQVRRKLIRIFSLPREMRPPAARDPLALIYFAYDMEDPVEGVRVSGADGFDGKNWEVGQVIFSKWWWALDSEIIRNSNRLREARGAPRLQITSS